MSEQDHRGTEAGGGSLVLTALWRAKIAIAVVAVLFGVGAYEVSLLGTPTYEAEAGVVLKSTQSFDALGTAQGGGDPERYLATQIAVMTSGTVLTQAAATEGVSASEAELAEALVVLPSDASDSLTVTATAPTAAEAATRANAVVAAYQAYVTAQVAAAAQAATDATALGTTNAVALVTDPDVVAATRAAGAQAVAEIAARAAQYGNGVAVVDAATAPASPTEPQPTRNALIATVLGALVAAAVAVWSRGARRDDAEALVRSSGVPVLGVVPVGRRRDQHVTEALAPLVSLQYLAVGRRPGPVLVTALQAQDSTADVVLGLAAAAVKEGQRVLLLTVGSDDVGLVQRSGLPVAPQPLTSAAAGGELPSTALAPVPALTHLPGGHEASLASLGGGLLRSDDLTRVLERLGAAFDLVVVAAGPVARDARAYALVRGCATVVTVVHGDRSFASVSTAWDDLQDRLAVAARPLDGVIITQRAVRGRRSARSSSQPPGRPVPAAVAPPAPPARATATPRPADRPAPRPVEGVRLQTAPRASGGAPRPGSAPKPVGASAPGVAPKAASGDAAAASPADPGTQAPSSAR